MWSAHCFSTGPGSQSRTLMQYLSAKQNKALYPVSGLLAKNKTANEESHFLNSVGCYKEPHCFQATTMEYDYDALQHRHTNPFHLEMYRQPPHPRQFKCNIQPILPSPVFGEFHCVSDSLAETVWNCADAQQLVFSISALLSQTHPEKYYSHLGIWSPFTLNQCVL